MMRATRRSTLPTSRPRGAGVGILLVPGPEAARPHEFLSTFTDCLHDWLRSRSTARNAGEDGGLGVYLTPGGRNSDDAEFTTLNIDLGGPNTLPRHQLSIAESSWTSVVRRSSLIGDMGPVARTIPMLVGSIFDNIGSRAKPRWWRRAVAVPGIIIGPSLGTLIMIPILTAMLLSALRVPGSEPISRWLEQRLTSLLGFSFSLAQSPSRLEVAVGVLRSDLQKLAQRCGTIVVVALADGAVVAHAALRQRLPVEVRSFVTVGSGVGRFLLTNRVLARMTMRRQLALVLSTLFAGPVQWLLFVATIRSVATVQAAVAAAFFLLGVVFNSAKALGDVRGVLSDVAARGNLIGIPVGSRRRTFHWIDYTASSDMRTIGSMRTVDECSARGSALPSRIVVHNRSSIWSDHRTYLDNQDEFFSSLAMEILGALPDTAQRAFALETDRIRLARRMRRSRVHSLAVSRVAMVSLFVAFIIQYRAQLVGMGGVVIDFTPQPVRRLVAKLLSPVRDVITLPADGKGLLGIVATLVAFVFLYRCLRFVWRQWDRDATRRLLSDLELRAGGPAFFAFVAITTAVILCSVEAILVRPNLTMDVAATAWSGLSGFRYAYYVGVGVALASIVTSGRYSLSAVLKGYCSIGLGLVIVALLNPSIPVAGEPAYVRALLTVVAVTTTFIAAVAVGWILRRVGTTVDQWLDRRAAGAKQGQRWRHVLTFGRGGPRPGHLPWHSEPGPGLTAGDAKAG